MVTRPDRPASPETVLRRSTGTSLFIASWSVMRTSLCKSSRSRSQEIEASRASRLLKIRGLSAREIPARASSQSMITPHGLKRRSKTRSPALRTSADSPVAPLPHRETASITRLLGTLFVTVVLLRVFFPSLSHFS